MASCFGRAVLLGRQAAIRIGTEFPRLCHSLFLPC